MHLLDSYSLASGSSIDNPWIYQKYFPLPTGKFITIHASSGMPSKNYDYYQEVIELISDDLNKNEFKIIQIGGKDDPKIEGALDFRGKSDIHQTAFIIDRTSLHVGNDSFSVHMAGFYQKPLVALYGATNPNICGPYFHNCETTSIIEADRKCELPSYASQENPKTINNIKPEVIAKRILELLHIDKKIDIQTLYIGPKYNNQLIEIVPDGIVNPSFIQGVLNLRGDLEFNPEFIYKQLVISKCAVITKKELDINILNQLKKNLVVVIAYPETINYDFIKKCRLNGIPFSLITDTDGEELNKLKFKYFDLCNINKKPNLKKKDIENNDKIGDNTYIKTNRLLLARGKVYSTASHWKIDQPCKSFDDTVSKIIDNDEFWKEHDTYYIFNKE